MEGLYVNVNFASTCSFMKKYCLVYELSLLSLTSNGLLILSTLDFLTISHYIQ